MSEPPPMSSRVHYVSVIPDLIRDLAFGRISQMQAIHARARSRVKPGMTRERVGCLVWANCVRPVAYELNLSANAKCVRDGQRASGDARPYSSIVVATY